MLSLSPTNNWEKRDITLPSCNKISGSQQSFFQDRNGHFMICIVGWWKKSHKCNHRKVIQSYFFLPYNCRATVCWDPRMLLVSRTTWHNDFSLLRLGNKENSDSNKVWCLFNHTRDKFGLIFKPFQKTCSIHTYRQATSFYNIPRMMFNSFMI